MNKIILDEYFKQLHSTTWGIFDISAEDSRKEAVDWADEFMRKFNEFKRQRLSDEIEKSP